MKVVRSDRSHSAQSRAAISLRERHSPSTRSSTSFGASNSKLRSSDRVDDCVGELRGSGAPKQLSNPPDSHPQDLRSHSPERDGRDN